MNKEIQEAIDILRTAVTPNRRICHCGEDADEHHDWTHTAVPMDEPEETALNVLVDRLTAYERLSFGDLLRLWWGRLWQKPGSVPPF